MTACQNMPHSRMLADLCLPLSADIQTPCSSGNRRCITRGLDLPAGRLFLLEGWYDEYRHTNTAHGRTTDPDHNRLYDELPSVHVRHIIGS